MKNQHSNLVVVLGMHRSGTSAIARGLEVLGVTLGDNLHPADVDNPKGFWEDRDFLDINEELLVQIGSAYDRIGLIDWKLPDTSIIESLKVKAKKLVCDKCDQFPLWGFKDPRTARLLPFWQPIFDGVGCNVRYVIATRNPISIVESLRKRDGSDPEKTFYLWLEHLIPSILGSKGAVRVVVDYDRTLENPGRELLRVAQALDLPAPDPSSLAAFENEFLETGLRHTIYTTDDLERYPDMPSQVISAYRHLVMLATDDDLSDNAKIEQAFESLFRELVDLSPVLKLIDRQEQLAFSRAATRQEQLATAMQAQVDSLRSANAWMTSQRDAWEQLAARREQSVQALQAQVQQLQRTRNHSVKRFFKFIFRR